MKWINYNSKFYKESENLFLENILSQNALCEKITVKKKKILFWEDYYFFLMSSMRILRIKIPMNYTPSYLEEELSKTIEINNIENGVFNFFCFLYEGKTCFLIKSLDLKISISYLEDSLYEIDFYKDFKLSVNSLLSGLPFSYVVEKNLATTYKIENNLKDLILVNNQNRIAQSLNGYIFLIKENEILTPKIEEGLRKNIIQKKFIKFLQNFSEKFQLKETEISPFELQSSEELFFLEHFTIRAITNFRKKNYETKKSKEIFKNWEEYLENL